MMIHDFVVKINVTIHDWFLNNFAVDHLLALRRLPTTNYFLNGDGRLHKCWPKEKSIQSLNATKS